ncbi:hypothetical protein O181_069373 [Austropuccinia psidii MF-1]|uniref:Tet-like 2OG-Fe(II) oxygenase domain-containing protein n=1 Tax=Austropuccinia psidii MF-1 TaxID=1389203 RepID=A0A9Q3I6B3_9BASI|nr:hypothetical protein [Austropuccinia psidii MF-1]
MNGLKNPPHFDKDAQLYSLGWWSQADKQTRKIQKDASEQCTGGKFIFPKDHFWIDLSKLHVLIQVVWASSKFLQYTDPEKENKSTTLVRWSAQCSRKLAKKMWQKSHGYHKIGKGLGYQIRDSNTTSSQFE